MRFGFQYLETKVLDIIWQFIEKLRIKLDKFVLFLLVYLRADCVNLGLEVLQYLQLLGIVELVFRFVPIIANDAEHDFVYFVGGDTNKVANYAC